MFSNRNKGDQPPLKYRGVDGLQARSTHRVPRMSALLKKFINFGLQMASDPELARLRISKVEVAPDLSEAAVWFFTTEDLKENITQQRKKLEGATAFLRRYLAKNILLRRLPSLRFKPDLNGIDVVDFQAYIQRLNN